MTGVQTCALPIYCLDFRPRKADGGTSLANGQIPDPNMTVLAAYQYYLSRIDKIIATSDQKLIVKRGVSAVYPAIPADETNGMGIYNIVIPPYTANVADIQVQYIENKRYTMRDIGKLENRITNLEYYTQLTLLEKQANDISIPDSNGLEKFKNGFAVDPFTSSDIPSAGTDWSKVTWGWWASWFNGSTTWSNAATNYNKIGRAHV